MYVTEAYHVYCIGRLCGAAAVLLGQTEKAREHYQQALEICTRVRFRPEVALTRLGLAEPDAHGRRVRPGRIVRAESVADLPQAQRRLWVPSPLAGPLRERAARSFSAKSG